MRSVMKIAGLTGVLALGIVGTAKPYAHTNFNWAYDSHLWKGIPPRVTKEVVDGTKKTIVTSDKYKTSYGVAFEYGFDPIGIDKDGVETHHLRIFSDASDARLEGTEAALGAFVGNNDANTNAYLTSMLLGGTLDGSLDGKRGYVKLDGKRKETDINLWFTGLLPFESLPGRWDFGVYIPFKTIKTEDISWEFIPHPDGLADFNIKAALADRLPYAMDTFAKGLNVDKFHAAGLGDVTTVLTWSDQYDQANEGLSKVGLFARAGIMFPTSQRCDKNNALAIPLGNDGAWGVPLSTGMDLMFENKLRLTAMADILFLFNEEAERRLRQSTYQTGMLLSETTVALRQPGNQLRISVLGERIQIADILSLGVGYQGSWHSEDKYSVDDPTWTDSDSGPINTTEQFQDSNYHNIIGHVGFNWEDADGTLHGPRLDLFYKYPLKMGKRVAAYKTLGANLTWSF